MSAPMRPEDPAYWMMTDGFTTTPTVHDPNCYICTDDEYRRMGLPLCHPCPLCEAKHRPGDEIDGTVYCSCGEGDFGHVRGHVPADDTVCTVCGRDTYPPEAEMLEGVAKITDLPDIENFS